MADSTSQPPSAGPPSDADASSKSSPQGRVQGFIDSIFGAVVDELMLPDGKPAITLKKRSNNPSNFFINPTSGAVDSRTTETSVTYSWPGKNLYESWRFTVIIRIVGIIAQAVQDGLTISKRDIYYHDPACFGTQRVVDSIVDDIACTIGVSRAALNVEAASKGLMAGNFILRTKSGDEINPWLSLEDTLIPRMDEISDIDIDGVQWVMILEKEAVFRRLAQSSYHTTASCGKGILVTGKGYPDICTRAFVRQLADTTPANQTIPRFYALVDGDPDGMAIMSTYKYGSMKQAHENPGLSVGNIEWLGLRTSDLVTTATLPNADKSLIRLTPRDRKKAVTLLRNSPVWAEDGPELEWRAELQQMLILNLKGEAEILYDRDRGLEEWIDSKMRSTTTDR